MANKLGQAIARNWPIKLAALFFAVMLYVAVAAQQPITQSFTLRLDVDGPPGRPIKQPAGEVAVLISGKGSELFKLRALSRVIPKAIPDTFSGSIWHWRLQASDVPIPKGADVLVADITPRDIEVRLDSAVHKDVRVASRVTVQADSGFLIQGLSVLPSTVTLIGPAKSVVAIDSVATVATTISSTNGPFFHTVPLDTSPLGPVRVLPREVRVSGEVLPLLQRSFTGVVVTPAATGFAGLTLATERVVVEVSGPEARVQALTRDSLRVVAHLVGHAAPDAYARLTVAAPPGITARAVPDSVGLKTAPKRKPGRG
jgi:hypothetical protein